NQPCLPGWPSLRCLTSSRRFDQFSPAASLAGLGEALCWVAVSPASDAVRNDFGCPVADVGRGEPALEERGRPGQLSPDERRGRARPRSPSGINPRQSHMPHLVLELQPSDVPTPCACCGACCVPVEGPHLARADTLEAVCRDCGRKHAPPLV